MGTFGGAALVGFLSKIEAVAWLRNAVVWDAVPTTDSLETLWRASRSGVDQQEPSLYTSLELKCPEELAAIGEQNPNIRGALRPFEGMQPQLLMVPLDLLVTHQLHVNNEQVQSLEKRLDAVDSLTELVDYCFPEPMNTPNGIAQGQHMFVSDNPNLVVLDVRSGRSTHEELGTEHPTTTVMVGVANQATQVVLFNGRLIVRNGYHRLLALLRKGNTEAPAILIQPRDQTEMALLKMPPGPTMPWFQLPLLTSQRPPLLRDFLDPTIAAAVRIGRPKKIIEVQFQISERIVYEL